MKNVFYLLLVLLCFISLSRASSFDPGKNIIRTKAMPATPDPVEATGGAFYFARTLLDIGGPMDMSFTVYYNSGTEQWDGDIDPPFWWSHKYNLIQVTWNGTNLCKIGFDKGSYVQFAEKDGAWHLTGPDYMGNIANGSSIKCELHVSSNYIYFVNYDAERVCIFERTPWNEHRIKTIFDRNTNSLTYIYPHATAMTPQRIEDNWGNYLDFLLEGSTITGVVDAIDRKVLLNYENALGNNNYETFVGFIDAMGEKTRFTYTVVTNEFGQKDFDNIASIISPEGNCAYSQVYARVALGGHDIARVIEQCDAYGNSVYFSYNTLSNIITTTWPNGGAVSYEASREYGALERITDANDETIAYQNNQNQQITTCTDREGDRTYYGYDDETRKLQSVTNAMVRTLACEYTTITQTFVNPFTNEAISLTFSDISTIHYQDGTTERFYYNDAGLLVSNMNRTGGCEYYSYDPDGMLLAQSNSYGGGSLYAWTDKGYLAAVRDTDPGIGTNNFFYDDVGRMLTNQYPDGTFSVCSYDANDNVIRSQDYAGRVTILEYDRNGNLIRLTDPNGNTRAQTYDLMDRQLSVTNRLNNVVARAYNACDMLASITDPLGNATHFYTDMQGNVTNCIDPAGNSFITRYSTEGLEKSTTSPLGHTYAFRYNALGYPIGMTNPLGHVWHVVRDEMNRVVATTDPDDREDIYIYNDGGYLTSVTNATFGSPQYLYNREGFLTNIITVNGGNWYFNRSPRGRVMSFVDPVGYETHFDYNLDGKLATIHYPDGISVQYKYNAMGVITQKHFSSGMSLNCSYDALGNLHSAENVVCVRDAEGNITNTLSSTHLFSAAYDAAGRIARLGYDNDTLAVFYTYDSRGYLSAISNARDNIVVHFSHNDDGLLTQIVRSNGVDTRYEWDSAGQLSKIQHGAIASHVYAYSAAGQVAQCEYTLPLDPAEYVTNDSQTLSFNAAYMITTSPYAYDARGRLTNAPAGMLNWDAASRLVQFGNASLAYNGLGALTFVVNNTKTNHFYYNYALKNTPPVADDSYYYIYTPAGRLVYLVHKTGAHPVRYFHYNRSGSTLFLTDDTGDVTDAYAYSPYGRLVQQTGVTEQPFTWCGRDGVMRPLDYDIYMMCVRWYDARTARFISREPAWPQLNDPRTLNPYQYAANNPVRYNDASGLKYEEEIAEAERDLQFSHYTYNALNVIIYPFYKVGRAVDMFFNEPIAPVVKVEDKETYYQYIHSRHLWVSEEASRLRGLKRRQAEYEEQQKREAEKRQRRRAFEKKVPALRKLALKKAREAVKNMKIANKKAPHPWGQMDHYQNMRWGLWIKADGQWLFFQDPDRFHTRYQEGQLMYRDGDRVLIHTRANGTDVGLWLHNVQGVHEGNGPAW